MAVAKRLSQALADFAARILAKGPAAAAAVVAFLENLILTAPTSVRDTDAGPMVGKNITLGAMAKLAALPALDGTLAVHTEMVLERIGNEIEARGAVWQKEGLHGALTEHLIKALKPAEPGLDSRVAALETVVRGASAPPPAYRSEATSPTGPFGTPPAPPAATE